MSIGVMSSYKDKNGEKVVCGYRLPDKSALIECNIKQEDCNGKKEEFLYIHCRGQGGIKIFYDKTTVVSIKKIIDSPTPFIEAKRYSSPTEFFNAIIELIAM
jgi:hypothetical protein